MVLGRNPVKHIIDRTKHDEKILLTVVTRPAFLAGGLSPERFIFQNAVIYPAGLDLSAVHPVSGTNQRIVTCPAAERDADDEAIFQLSI